MVRTKVFVGNLDFQTKESTLVTEFSAAGKVIGANIITRGPRSLGYGFVEMDSEDDAQKAVGLMNKKEVDGRPINVEVAKVRDETQPQQAPAEGQRGGRGGARGGRGGRGGRGRGSPRGASRGAPARGGAFRPRGGRGGNQATGEGQPQTTTTTTTTTTTQQQQPKEKRERKEKREENRTPSKTTLFVANLPFKMDDEGFAKVFKDAGVAYKSAHVVKNQRSGRSKGFGFAEFENEQDQQKALTAVDKKVVDERELAVKVALTENPATKPASEEPAKN